VWLKLDGGDQKYPMVISDCEMLPGTNEMRYELKQADGKPYKYGNSKDGWVPERLLTERNPVEKN
jgi:hypothetical protein